VIQKTGLPCNKRRPVFLLENFKVREKLDSGMDDWKITKLKMSVEIII